MIGAASFATLVHFAAIGIGLSAYFLATHLGRQRRHPSAAVAWVLAIFAFPYLAVPLFLLLGSRKTVRPACTTEGATGGDLPASVPRWARRLSSGLALPAPCGNRSILVLADGPSALDALLALIESARHSLDICTFIFADDEVGQAVATGLANCARRGVRTRLLLDGIGSRKTSRRLRGKLVEAGVELRWFMPLLHDPTRGRSNLRNHRKLAVADRARMWSGGRNIAEEYFLDREGVPAWWDLSFTVDGPLAADAAEVFERDWRLAGGRRGTASSPARDQPRVAAFAQLIPGGPDHADDTVYAYLLTALYQAQDNIFAATPYFVPDDSLLQALVFASHRGVRVDLLLPWRSNHQLADLSRERALRELAAAGARLHCLPDMLHAKLVLVDQSVAVCGSANLDGRSLFLNYELSTAFYGSDEIEAFRRWSDRMVGLAKPYSPQPPSWARDLVEGVVRAVAFQM